MDETNVEFMLGICLRILERKTFKTCFTNLGKSRS